MASVIDVKKLTKKETIFDFIIKMAVGESCLYECQAWFELNGVNEY